MTCAPTLEAKVRSWRDGRDTSVGWAALLEVFRGSYDAFDKDRGPGRARTDRSFVGRLAKSESDSVCADVSVRWLFHDVAASPSVHSLAVDEPATQVCCGSWINLELFLDSRLVRRHQSIDQATKRSNADT